MSHPSTIQRRVTQFKAHRRGYYALWGFGLLLIITSLAPFIANDQPLLVYYEGRFHSPLMRFYPETYWGGDFETATNYHDPMVQGLIQKKGWMLFPLIPFSDQTIDDDITESAPAPPSRQHWLGTDDQGRDVLARLIYGARVSLWFSILLTCISATVGVIMGAIQGYFGGWVDLCLQRMIEVWSGLPILYLLIILSSMVEPGFWWLLGIMGLVSWMVLVPVVRAEFFRARTLDFVRAAELMGVPTRRIIFKHILPNAMIATITYLPFMMSSAITLLTSLDFIGFGLPPGSSSLGELLTQGRNNIQAPWLALTGFMAMSLILSLLIFIGEAVRDAFDPRRVQVP